MLVYGYLSNTNTFFSSASTLYGLIQKEIYTKEKLLVVKQRRTVA